MEKEIEIIIKGSNKINNTNLYKFLSEQGFAIMSDGNETVLVKITDKIAERATESDMIICVKRHLETSEDAEGLETFIKGVSQYITPKKFNFLQSVNCFSDKDPIDKSTFYFKNCYVEVTASSIEVFDYSNSNKIIWKERIIDRNFNLPNNSECQYKEFMLAVSKKDPERCNVLKSIIGYMLHRHNDASVTKAIILMDENPKTKGEANGGTGKGLIAKAIEICRKTVTINGQQTKSTSRFNNQRVDITTDIIHYDDVKNNFNLDEIKSQITSGIVVEQKGKKEILINPDDAPKFLISTNYTVIGSGGSTDRRRRCEFELANHYNDQNRPIDEFGNLFFEGWSDEEWNKFFLLMFECEKYFLKNGLIECNPINIDNSRLVSHTCKEFEQFISNRLIKNVWKSKTELFEEFKNKFPFHFNLSPHTFTKWLKMYAKLNDLFYEDNNNGGKQSFKLKSKSKNEKEQ